MVVAETVAQAKDAAEAVVVKYEPLDTSVVTPAAADASAPRLYDHVGNVCVDADVGDRDATRVGPTRLEQQAGLPRGEGHGAHRAHRHARGRAGRAVDPARDVDRDHREAGRGERIDAGRRGVDERAAQPRAEHRVDDELRGVIYRWLKEHGHTRAARVFLEIEVLPGRALRKVTTFVRPKGRVLSTRVDEREVLGGALLGRGHPRQLLEGGGGVYERVPVHSNASGKNPLLLNPSCGSLTQ